MATVVIGHQWSGREIKSIIWLTNCTCNVDPVFLLWETDKCGVDTAFFLNPTYVAIFGKLTLSHVRTSSLISKYTKNSISPKVWILRFYFGAALSEPVRTKVVAYRPYQLINVSSRRWRSSGIAWHFNAESEAVYVKQIHIAWHFNVESEVVVYKQIRLFTYTASLSTLKCHMIILFTPSTL